ncbi:hypothetical protein BVX98_04125 [bacterium F11]|nr:hypothetical protein BVX98_04125 [bacterium F11]
MRIGIDSRPLSFNHTNGITAHVRNVVEQLGKMDRENEYVLYSHREFDCSLPSERWKKKVEGFTRPGSLWMQVELPFWLRRDKIDIFWGTQHVLPIRAPKKVKTVLTIHDMVHFAVPDTMRTSIYFINKLIVPPSVARADAIVADSHSTMNDLKKYLKPKKEIMEVVHLAKGNQFSPRNRVDARNNIQAFRSLSGPFILTVGTFEPRKNMIRAFQAFASVASKIPHSLVVVGPKGWKDKEALKELQNSSVRDRIHFLGYVPDEFLPDIYSAADLFFFPSLYEGFGLPPLEAMSCGLAVVASKSSSIPEVVGSAALLVDPLDIDDMASKILNVLTNSHVRRDMIEKGLVQSRKFSWEKTGQQMKDIFSRVWHED